MPKARSTFVPESDVKDKGVFFAYEMPDAAMEPKIRKGALVLCGKGKGLVPGAIVVLRVAGKTICRRLSACKGSIVLVADNPAFEPLSFKVAEIEWAYRAVRVSVDL
jgi:SOS-response transcriptional repressor LexA